MNWKHILWRIFNQVQPEEEKKVLKQPDQLMPKNIYEGKTTHSFVKKFRFVHFRFKYRFMLPLLWIGDKILGRFATTKISDDSWNINIKAFDVAFENALDDWVYKFLAPLYNLTLERAERFRRTDRCIKILNMMKKWYLTIILTDTAYRETHNCLMHSIAKEMFRIHKSPNPVHIFYRSKDCYNPIYFSIWDKLAEGQIEIRLAEGKDVLRKEGQKSATVSTATVEVKRENG